jgi:hypothetical protein
VREAHRDLEKTKHNARRARHYRRDVAPEEVSDDALTLNNSMLGVSVFAISANSGRKDGALVVCVIPIKLAQLKIVA